MKKRMSLLSRSKSKKGKGQPVPAQSAWDNTPGNEMLIKEVLSPLLDIILLYKESSAYNYVPGTEEDADAGWQYFERCFQAVYRGLCQNLYLSQVAYLKVHKVIDEIQAFVRQYSGADGLPERYFEINPNLVFYRSSFELREENEEAYELARKRGMLGYVPSETDFIRRKEYFSEKEKWSTSNNFQYDRDDFFIQELASTLRLVFLTDLTEDQAEE